MQIIFRRDMDKRAVEILKLNTLDEAVAIRI